MVVMTLPLEIKNRIDYMLERLRPCYHSVFCNMTDEKSCHSPFLGLHQQLPGHFSQLCNITRSGIEPLRIDCLHRIDYQTRRIEPSYLLKNPLEAGFRKNVEFFWI